MSQTKFTLAKYTTHLLHQLDMTDDVAILLRFWPEKKATRFECVWVDSYGEVTGESMWFPTIEDAQQWARELLTERSTRRLQTMLGDDPHKVMMIYRGDSK